MRQLSRLVPSALAFMALSATPAAHAQSAQEQFYSPSILQVGAPAAWNRGTLGSGVSAAIIDTGLDVTHVEFSGRIRDEFLARGLNALTGKGGSDAANVRDDHGHGTMVAGVVAAALNGYGVVGMAPHSRLLPVKVMDASGAGTAQAVGLGIRHAATRARVSNLSLSYYQPAEAASFEYAARMNRKHVFVVAAGNDGAANPTWPARFAPEKWMNGQMVVVGSVDANEQISTFSNRAGATRNFYLVAPGENIISTLPGNGYGVASGTSLAAPHVTGAALLVSSHWPSLTGAQVVQILLRSARDLGAPGVDEVYGWGMLDVNRAMLPLGELGLGTRTSRTQPYFLTNLVLPAAMAGSSIGKAVALGTDEFGRAFSVNIGLSASRNKGLTLDDITQGLESATGWRSVSSGLSRFSWQSAENRFAPNSGMPAFLLESPLSNKTHLTAGFGSAYRFTALPELADAVQQPALGRNAHLDLVGSGMHMGLQTAAAGPESGTSFRVAALATPGERSTRLAGSSTGAQTRHAFVAEARHVEGATSVSLLVGQVAEPEGLLGASGNAAFSLGHSRTQFVSLNGTWKLSADTALAGSMSRGITRMGAPRAGLIEAVTPLHSDAWSLGLVSKAVLSANDRVSVALSQPMRVRSGELILGAAESYNEDGSLNFGTQHYSLVPSARETRLGLGYSVRAGKLSEISAAGVIRFNADHERGVRETAAGVRFMTRF